MVAFVDVYKLIYHFFHYKVLFTSIFWLFPDFAKKQYVVHVYFI